MAFGNAITDFVVVADGTAGNVIGISLEAELVKEVVQVQLKNTAGAYSAINTQPVSLAALFGYLSEANPPSFAWTQQGPIVYVFLLASAYPYVNTNRLALWWFRNAIPLATTSDKLDIPPDAKDLFISICLRLGKQTQDKRVELDVELRRIREKKLLGLT